MSATAVKPDRQRRFTGWHMLAIMLAFFGTIISVNVLMAYYASSSWSGILAKNTYVASQDFNKNAAKAREWTNEGFKGAFSYADGRITYKLEGPDALLSRLKDVTAIFHRPVGEAQDFTLALPLNGKATFSLEHKLASGRWVVDLAAIENGETVFHQAVRITVGE